MINVTKFWTVMHQFMPKACQYGCEHEEQAIESNILMIRVKYTVWILDHASLQGPH